MCRRARGRTTRSTASRSRPTGWGCCTLDPGRARARPAAVQEALAARIFDLEHVPRERARPDAAARRRERARPEPALERRTRARTRARPKASPRRAPTERPPRGADLDAGSEAPRPAAPRMPPRRVARSGEHTGSSGSRASASRRPGARGVLIAELYLGVIVVAFGARPARCSGSRSRSRRARARSARSPPSAPGERGWACACAIGGAPVVAWFALLRPSGPGRGRAGAAGRAARGAGRRRGRVRRRS